MVKIGPNHGNLDQSKLGTTALTNQPGIELFEVPQEAKLGNTTCVQSTMKVELERSKSASKVSGQMARHANHFFPFVSDLILSVIATCYANLLHRLSYYHFEKPLLISTVAALRNQSDLR